MSFDTWEDVVAAAALGDPEATSMIASKLAAVDEGKNSESARVQAAEQRARAAEAGLAQFAKGMKIKAAWEKETGLDAQSDPEAYAEAVKIDSSLAQTNPDLEFRSRLNIAGDIALEKLGPAESRGNREWIAQERARRTGVEVEEDYYPQQTDPAEADHSSVIAQMSKERRGNHVQQLSPEELKAQQRPQRRFAHPPR